MIVSLFAIIVGLPPRLFAIIVRPTQTVFASPRHTVCKPLHIPWPMCRRALGGKKGSATKRERVSVHGPCGRHNGTEATPCFRVLCHEGSHRRIPSCNQSLRRAYFSGSSVFSPRLSLASISFRSGTLCKIRASKNSCGCLVLQGLHVTLSLNLSEARPGGPSQPGRKAFHAFPAVCLRGFWTVRRTFRHEK